LFGKSESGLGVTSLGMRVKPTLQFIVQMFYQLLEEITQFTAQKGAQD
jgi:hypothetical protein